MVLGRSLCAYLDLQNVVAAQALVVHVMIRLIRVTTILILDEGEARNANCQRLLESRGHILTGWTYSLLLAERGAGMSQRTRRP